MGNANIWGAGQPDSITGKVKTFVEREAQAAQREKLKDAPLSDIFACLEGKEPFPLKKLYAENVLNGGYGIRNEILAKLMLGPLEFQEVVAEKRDILPPLLELVSHESAGIRVKVAQVLGERGDERALPALFNGLWEEKYVVRYEFGNALARLCGRLSNPEQVEKAKAVIERRMNELQKEGKYEFSSQHNGISRRLEEVLRFAQADDAKPIPLQFKPDGAPIPLQPKAELKQRPDVTKPIRSR